MAQAEARAKAQPPAAVPLESEYHHAGSIDWIIANARAATQCTHRNSRQRQGGSAFSVIRSLSCWAKRSIPKATRRGRTRGRC